MQTTYLTAHVILHPNNRIGRLPLTAKTAYSTFPKKILTVAASRATRGCCLTANVNMGHKYINKLTYMAVLWSMGELIYS